MKQTKAVAEVSQDITEITNELVGVAKLINQKTHNRQEFVNQVLEHYKQARPLYNVLVVDNRCPHIATLSRTAHQHVELRTGKLSSAGFDIYVFYDGVFTKGEDQADQHCGHIGNFENHGNCIQFFKMFDVTESDDAQETQGSTITIFKRDPTPEMEESHKTNSEGYRQKLAQKDSAYIHHYGTQKEATYNHKLLPKPQEHDAKVHEHYEKPQGHHEITLEHQNKPHEQHDKGNEHHGKQAGNHDFYEKQHENVHEHHKK